MPPQPFDDHPSNLCPIPAIDHPRSLNLDATMSDRCSGGWFFSGGGNGPTYYHVVRLLMRKPKLTATRRTRPPASFPWARDVRDQMAVILEAASINDHRAVDAFVGISAELYWAQHSVTGPAGWGAPSVLDDVVDMVESLSSDLAERFDLPAVEMTETGARVSRRQWGWKPSQMLWTAPVVEPASAWVLWAEKTGNHRVWDRQRRYESPSEASRLVVDSLATADHIIGDASFADTAHRLEAAGIIRLDFSWRCVLETECSILRGERDATAFPSALGTESSLWLTRPEPVSELHFATAPSSRPEPGWFNY